MRFLRFLFGRKGSEQAAECAPQFPYGMDAEAYGDGWTSPASQAARRAHRSKGWTLLDFRRALESFSQEIVVEDAPVDDERTDFDGLEFDALEPATLELSSLEIDALELRESDTLEMPAPILLSNKELSWAHC